MPAQRRVRSQLWAWILAGIVLSTGASGGGPPEHINQITGTLRFTNENAVILQWLNGPARCVVDASSLGDPVFWNYVLAESLDPTRFAYTIDVAATSVGLPYRVSASLTLSSVVGIPSTTTYRFGGSESLPALPEPANDVLVDVEECVGLIDVNWMDSNGEPISSDFNQVVAYPEGPGGEFSSRTQAEAQGEPLMVRGDGTLYRVEMVRTDTHDWTRLGCVQNVRVNCDEIVQVDCRLPDPGEPGTITGVVDLIGKEELTVPYATSVLAVGPLNNGMSQPLETTPSSGSFLLDGLVASTLTAPPTPYAVYADMTIAAGESWQRLRLPFETVLLYSGETVDLGEAFVTRPGYMIGEIELTGPPNAEGASCLADLQLLDDRDENGDGIPDAYSLGYSSVVASGHHVPAPGASRSAAGGYAEAGFVGTQDGANNRFRADYEMALAGLFSEPSLWRPGGLRLGFKDLSDPGGPIVGKFSLVHVSDQVDARLIDPRQTVLVDHRYCLGQVNLQVWSTEPDLIPYINVLGSLETDVPYDPAYTASGMAVGSVVCPVGEECHEGTPGEYSVELCLPQGSYTLRPYFRSFMMGWLGYRIPLTVEVGCRQALSLSTDLGVELEPVQDCAFGDDVSLRGSVYSTVDVQRIYYRLNGGPEVELCSNCGEDPPFSSQVPDAACANRIDVVAVDVNGHEASLSAAFDCLVETDADLDGAADCSDCAPGDAGMWSLPGEVSMLRLSHDAGSGTTSLTWDALENAGAVSASYVVRTRVRGTCHDAEVGAATAMIDEQIPSPGRMLQFLVGAFNGCGSGPFGEDSTGAARPSCP